MPSITYHHLEPIKFPLVNKYYQAQGSNNRASKNQQVVIAKNQENQIVGVARLSPIDNHWLLTGVHVAQSVRGQGIASQLVNTLCERQSMVFTFAFEHLTALYQGCGFEIIVPADIPCELAQRFNAYVKQGRKIVVMIRKN